MGKEKAGLEFSTKYRFMTGEAKTAVLDPNGRLTVFEGSSQEVWASWKDYVKKIMEETPVAGEQDILDQLGMLLGTAESCDVKVNATEKAEKKQAEKAAKSDKKDEDDMATKKAVKKAAPKKAKEEVELHPCVCGAADCDKMVANNFAPGHDARVHGWAKKIGRGDMKFSEIPASAQKFIRNVMKVTQGIKAKE